MNLKQLEYFVSVAEMGSFSKAAIVLNIAQPALSRQVRLLETDLHVTLLLRNGRGVVLTEAGKRLYDHSMGILQLMVRVREEIDSTRDEPSGRIVVGLPPSMGRILTLPLVEAFRQALPKAHLAVVEGLSAHLAEWIATGRVDLGLLMNPQPHEALEIVPVFDEALCLVGPAAPQGATDAADEAVTFSELAAFPLILPERSHAVRKLLEAQAALSGVKLKTAWEMSSIQSILDLVSAGYGYAILARTAVASCERPAAFTLREIVSPRLTTTLCLATSAHKQTTPLVRHVQNVLRELMLGGPAQIERTHNKA